LRGLRVFQRKVRKALLTHGVLGTFKFSAVVAIRTLMEFAPSRRRARALSRSADARFDANYGVDTAGVIPLSQLNISARSWIFGSEYQAIVGTVNFQAILEAQQIRAADFEFIDLGSGKGRAILLASSLPFKKVTGVEFAHQLHQVAEDNVRRWPAAERKCDEVELLCMDAGEYRFSASPFVLYMYNPFGRQIMQRVVENVSAAYQSSPRRIVVVYFTPKHGDLWERVDFLRKVAERPGYQVFDSAPSLQVTSRS
jgi:predicted RNA methylase